VFGVLVLLVSGVSWANSPGALALSPMARAQQESQPLSVGLAAVSGLFPSGVDGLADEQGGVRTLPRAKLLCAAVADLGNV
jgi:hypothetical protein